MPDKTRPDPDEILKVLDLESRLRKRGRLKVFFGGSAGVGKTFAMLQAAKSELLAKTDVVIGVVETHGRTETEKMAEGLPRLPKRQISHNNVILEEFDLDAALERRPKLILIDELAHTNAPGSRHPKRWQDVEEILEAGIDVYTTLNVQHLEGFNDVVASITGITVQEVVPDSLFDDANEIQLVDVPTEELLERLREGKVYIAPGAAERAEANFFSVTNLMSLRELALRRTAEHVDADTDYQRIQAGLFTPNIAGDRVLVCVGPDALAMKLVRATRKIANSLRAPWYALSVEKPSRLGGDASIQRQQRALATAEKNGAYKIATVQENHIGEAILNYARRNGITKIVIGRNIRSPLVEWMSSSLAEYIIRNSGNIDVYVITGHEPLAKARPVSVPHNFLDYAWATGGVSFCTLIGWMLGDVVQPIDMVLVYIVGLITCAAQYGRWPSVLYSFLSVIALNYFFVPPLYTLDVSNTSYWMTFLVMLIASLVITEQAGRLKAQTLWSRKREEQTQIFYALTRDLAGKRTEDGVVEAALVHLMDATGMTPVFWKPGADGRSLHPVGEALSGDLQKEESVARWAFHNRQSAGLGTNTMPSAQGYYFPLASDEHRHGVLSLAGHKDTNELTVAEKIIVETFAHLLVTALDRVHAARSAENMKVGREAERLKNTFLTSMSHDLRTPLSAIKGSAETLLKGWAGISEDARKSLLGSIRDETDRMSRVVKNLLDMTRFETGHILIKQEPYYLQELVGAVILRCKPVLQNLQVKLDIPKELPMIYVDALLIDQLLQNLVENAASFSRPGQTITVSTVNEGDYCRVEVSDEGPGIAVGKEEQIFEKFVTMSKGDRPKGAGLGLAICKAIVQAHHGTITAANRSRNGAVFTFTLPVYQQ